MLFTHLNSIPISIMEARNFCSSKEMIDSGNWLVPTLNAEPRFEKPPLPTWITACFGLIFGLDTVFFLRVPVILMVLFSGLFIYLFVKKLGLSKENCFQTTLIFLTSFYVFAIALEAPWDIYAYGFTVAAIYYLFIFFTSDHFNWKSGLAATFLLGLSILSKGPVSLYTMLLPFLISYGFIYGFKKGRNYYISYIFILSMAILIGGWWYVYIRLHNPVEFSASVTQESSSWSTKYVQPFYFYWNFVLQSGVWALPASITLLYPYMIRRVEHKKIYQFTFLWVIIGVLLISIIPEKKARYVVPILFPLAINIGIYLNYLLKNFQKTTLKKNTYPVYFSFGIIGLISISIPLIIFFLYYEAIAEFIFLYILLTICFFLIGILIFVNLYKKRMITVFYSSFFLMSSFLLLVPPIAMILDKNSAYKSMTEIHSFEKKYNVSTFSCGDLSPELLWDYKGIIKNIVVNNIIKLPSQNKFGILITEKDRLLLPKYFDKNYTIQYVETYDLNLSSKTRQRLVQQLYLISKN